MEKPPLNHGMKNLFLAALLCTAALAPPGISLLAQPHPAGASRQAGKGPLKVFILAGQSNMEGQAVVDLEGQDYNDGKGTLQFLMRDPQKAPLLKHLKAAQGQWAVRNDVWVCYQLENGSVKAGPLAPGFTPYGGKHHFGPELQFGQVMGDLFENQVLLIKTAWGGKSLYEDFRPPSSGGKVGPYYTRMLKEIRSALENLKSSFPGYEGSGYELTGFVWYQGWNDGCDPKRAVPEYEQNLVNFIRDVRKDLNAPQLPFVIGELTGPWVEAPGEWKTLRQAQAAAVARPEFQNNALFVETHEFVRKAEDSPNPGHGHHEFGNAETYFLVGDALGAGMKKLLPRPQRGEKREPSKPAAHTIRHVEGWTVRVDDRLLAPPNEALGARALRFLEYKLSDIKAVIAPEPLARLQAVTIVLDLSHGNLRSMQYHPSADWLAENGYATNLAKCVHIPEAADLATPRNITEQPWVVLHELAHAYHDQVLGFEEPRILRAYQDYKRTGHGDQALLFDGSRVRHYGLTDQKEFFAEMTESYFGVDDFFPFNRAELMTAEPEICELMQSIWGPVAGRGIKSAREAGGVKLKQGVASTTLLSAEGPADKSLLTVDRIFGNEEFKTQDWGPARWLKDGSGYTTLEESEMAAEAKDIVRYDSESGRREVLVFASNLLARGESKPLKIVDYAWSEDGRKLLVFTNTKRVWRKETRGDYWVFDRKSRELKKIGGKAAPSTLMFATLSPNGQSVAYVCQNNLFTESLDSGRVTQLTKDGSDTIINGTSDWVYEEEFGLRNGFRWSPDGKQIAYWQFDTSGVREFKLINNTDGLYPRINSYAYPKVGETNSSCRVGIVNASGGKTRWFRPNADPRNHYIPMMEWSEDSTQVVFQQLNRLQNTNQVICGNARSGGTQVLFTDRDDAWVEVVENWRWIENGARFLWLSERDGWQHIYAVAGTHQQMTLLTPGAFDAMNIAGVDEKRRCVYFTASPENPTQRYLYRAPLDGSGRIERVSPADQPGTHSYDISKDCRWAFHTYSRFEQPPVIELVSLPDHKVVRVLADNAGLRANLGELKPCPSEFFRLDIGEGVQLDAWCIKPPEFDPAKRYPLVIYVYGEPAGTTVTDGWGGETHLWHRLLAQQGYVIVSIDNRGTPAPRGREWRKSVYRQIGILASADQAAATRQILKDRPYLDPNRVGIWGWSGGGSMSLNAIFRYPDLYRTAMAIAFVSNQRLYDTIYQERYMGLPADNVDGFKNGSPITFAPQLKGHLLLVYGTGDDNCHYQNCELLINELIRHNKQFSLMSYPNRTHAIREGDNTKRHLFETLTRYLSENLPTVPRQTAGPGNSSP